jgi:hypothetical protein
MAREMNQRRGSGVFKQKAGREDRRRKEIKEIKEVKEVKEVNENGGFY